ncbi:MAG: hypothetical protein J6J61_04375 [Muribaculaceae bacterium]|nr:hypothetical protein [Muribaculaceae bacterium]
MARKFFTALILLIVSVVGASAQSAAGRYASRMTPDGTLFFVMPHKLGDTHGIKHFEYDMTLLSWTDSVTINFTFQASEMERPADLELCSGDSVYRCDRYSPLFTDIKKNGYEIRITSAFSAAAIKAVISSKEPPVFRFRQNGKAESAGYKPGAWLKDRKKLQDIFRLYEYAK